MNAAQPIPPDIVSLGDYERYARTRLDDNAWAYFSGGAADELTLRDNRDAFDRLKILPRVLTELAGGNTRTELLGRTFEHPIFLAPVAYQKLAHADGELAMALGAAAMRTGTVLSTQATVSLEEFGAIAQSSWWFQVYIQPDRGFVRALIERAEAAGADALVITVDAPINGVRNREQRAGFRLPPGVDAVNLRGQPAMPMPGPGESAVFNAMTAAAATWRDVEWLLSFTKKPVLLKGILSPEDAARAVSLGVAGLIVSNHGGRTLDTVPASIDALPRIADRIAGARPLLLDGGVRRGTDVFKALALGASAVLIGRPYIHGLAVAGAVGVAHVLKILRAELEATMALAGCPTMAHITREAIWRS
jgi:4-hydroxymandelate oxidase